MMHRKKTRKLQRTKEHRKALLRNLLISLIKHGSIITTTPKAKALKGLADSVITRAKDPSLHSKREVMKLIHDRDAVRKLFEEIAPRYKERPGGYTRIVRVGRRRGDGAELSLIELIQ